MYDLSRKVNESELAYIYRLGEAKNNGLINMNWTELAEVLNQNLRESDEYLTESAYRKKFAVMKQAYEEIFSKQNTSSADELAELRDERNELIKERIKIGDERRELKALLREQARKENFNEQIQRILTEYKPEPIDVPAADRVGELDRSVSMLIGAYDIHSGLKIDNWWNKYNEDVVKERFVKYIDQIKAIQERHHAEDAYVVISEIISGLIHNRLRIEANEDVIKQFVNVCSVLNWFLLQLSYMFDKVNVYVAPGNHSRLFPNKDENMKGENFDHLAIYYLRGYLQNVKNIEFFTNDIEESMAIMNIRGQRVFAVHGDKDTPDNICRHITELTKIIPDICVMGHMHSNKFLTTNGGCKVIQNGSFCSMDNYCLDNRLSGRPEQMVAIISGNGLECIYDVGLR